MRMRVRKRCKNCKSHRVIGNHPVAKNDHYCGQECLNLQWLKEGLENGSVISRLLLRTIDGDTVETLHEKGSEPISFRNKHGTIVEHWRLVKMDAPEKRQSYGKNSWQALSSIIPDGSWIYISNHGTDHYHRNLGEIFTQEGKSILDHMISTGNAWYYQYGKEPLDSHLKQLQQDAKSRRLGLWAEDSPMEPSKFRKRQKRKQ